MWKTTYENFSDFLTRIGVGEGDALMVHSFLPSLGELADGQEGLYRSLRERLGKTGTLIVPTFTYSFCRGEDFDVRRSPSTVGSFSEFVRGQEGTVRSADPIFSIVAVGALAAEATRIRQPTCFGVGSVFESLERLGVKFLLLGIDYTKSLTYFLHLEQLGRVPYRMEKLFSGGIVDGDGTRREATFSYYVRRDLNGVRMDYNRLGSGFDESPACRRSSFGYGTHRLFGAQELRAYTLPRVAQDPYCLTMEARHDAAAGAALGPCW